MLMLYMNNAFSNYTEFQTMFGISEHGNGEKSRRNKILLSLFKSKEILHYMAIADEKTDNYINYYGITSMQSLYNNVMEWLHKESYKPVRNRLNIFGLRGIYSGLYKSDDFNGLCEDADTRSIRYVNIERDRVFKMKAGKFLRKLIEENPNINTMLPEQVKIWVCEEFAEQWKAYAAENICKDEYTLYINENFEDIYNSDCLKGNFGSCMVDDDYWSFYRDSVCAKAAYLLNNDDEIVARCIIYTDVIDGMGNHLRLAERQYSTDSDESLKRMLVMRLIEGNHIDGYKKVGADCHSPKAFVDVHGNPLSNTSLHIKCDLENYDVVSYQDSFKWYDSYEMIAYNYGDSSDGNLSVTDGRIENEDDEDDHENERWSDYHEEYIHEDDAYYVETRDDYFYYDEVVYAYVKGNYDYYREDCHKDDCVEINGEYYYAGYDCEDKEIYGIYECPECGSLFVPDREDAVKSELTGEWYCDSYCKESAEDSYREDHNCRYDEIEDEYYDVDKTEDVRILVYDWCKHRRVNAYTKRENLIEWDSHFVNYKGNWYYNNIDKSAGMPQEMMQKDMFVA